MASVRDRPDRHGLIYGESRPRHPRVGTSMDGDCPDHRKTHIPQVVLSLLVVAILLGMAMVGLMYVTQD